MFMLIMFHFGFQKLVAVVGLWGENDGPGLLASAFLNNVCLEIKDAHE